MVQKDQLIKIKNRTNGTAGYKVPDLNNLHRNFAAGEVKEVTAEEVRKLSYLPGGKVLLKECLIIDNAELLKEILGEVEPEYYYTKTEIEYILQYGTLEQLLDCLDFAPAGVIDLMKDLAVKMEIPDIRKRDAILKATGFSVTNAINFNHVSEEEAKGENENNGRRAAPVTKPTEETTSERRTTVVQTPKYNVVTTTDK